MRKKRILVVWLVAVLLIMGIFVARKETLLKLPVAYDSRQDGRVPQVKNQGELGTCWAFASLTALESSLMPEKVLDFSEDHMSINNSFSLPQNAGGDYTMSMAYLLAWQGPVWEADDPYGDGVSPVGLKAVKHVQEIQIIPKKDYEEIKRWVISYGGVQSSLYTSMKNHENNSSYCYIGEEPPNHDVVIVGWDDTYSRENFDMDLDGDGAFLCVSSWGSQYGDQGFFYVSYHDTNIGIYNVVYSKVEEPDNYGHIYQTDLCGWVGQLGYGEEMAYGANVYQTEQEEVLQAVGFYATGEYSEYEIYVARNVNDSNDLTDREVVAKGQLQNSGYYTISLEKTMELEAEERFGIILRLVTPEAIHPMAIEYEADANRAQVDISDGKGYISFNGSEWESLEEVYNCNLCLKAYTTSLGNTP